MRATCLANLIFFDFITLIKPYMVMNKNREAPSHATINNLLLPPQTLGSKHLPQHPTFTFNRCSSLNVRDKFARPNNATGKIIILYYVIFMLLDSKR